MRTDQRWIAALAIAVALPVAGHATKPARATWQTWVASGKPVDCLPITSLRQSHVRDDQTIDFDTAGGKVYRVTLPQPCPELGFEQAFSYETSLSQLCSTDIIRVLHQSQPRFPGASCGLSSFQPIAPPAGG